MVAMNVNQPDSGHQLLARLNAAQAVFLGDWDLGAFCRSLIEECVRETDSVYGFIGEANWDSSGRPGLQVRMQFDHAPDPGLLGTCRGLFDRPLPVERLEISPGLEVVVSRQAFSDDEPAPAPAADASIDATRLLISLAALPFHPGQNRTGLLGLVNYSRGFELWSADVLRSLQRSLGQVFRAHAAEQQHQLAEEKLRLSDDHLRQVINSAPVFLFAVDGNGRLSLSAGQGLDLLGLPSEAQLGRSVAELYHHVPQLLESIRCSLAGEPVKGMIRIDNRFFEVRITPRLDESGQVQHVVGVANEVTGLKTAEADYHTKSAELERFTGNLKRLHRIHTAHYPDPKALFEDFLRAGCEIFGLPTGIIGRVIGETYRVWFVRTDLLNLKEGQEFKLEDTYSFLVYRDLATVAFTHVGMMVKMRGHPIYEKLCLETYIGTPIMVGDQFYGTLNFASTAPRQKPFTAEDREMIELMAQSLGRFIATQEAEAERVCAEAAMRQSESEARKLALVASRTDNAVVISDSRFRIEWVNAAFSRISGYLIDEIRGGDLRSMLYCAETDLDVKEFIRQKLDQVEPFTVESTAPRKDGSCYWAVLDCQPIFGDAGELVNYIAIASDITDTKRVEEARDQARVYEAATGARIHQSLLGGAVPRGLSQARVAASATSSELIDGDFYDLQSYSENTLDIFLGDVSGKGVSAALFGAGVKYQLFQVITHLMARRQDGRLPEPAEIVTRLGEEISPLLARLEKWVSLCYARLDFNQLRLDLVDCGFPKVIQYLSREKKCSLVPGFNRPLGAEDPEPIRQLSTLLQEGDILLFHSDGVTAAMNRAGESFGLDRLQRFIHRNQALSPEAIVRKLRLHVAEFCGTDVFANDLVSLVVKLKGAGELVPLIAAEKALSLQTDYAYALKAFLEHFFRRLPAPGLDGETESRLSHGLVEAIGQLVHDAAPADPAVPIQVVAEAFDDRIQIQISIPGVSVEAGEDWTGEGGIEDRRVAETIAAIRGADEVSLVQGEPGTLRFLLKRLL